MNQDAQPLTNDPAPFAGFIVERMLKNLPGSLEPATAVAETEIPIEGDDWFWADDNAKVLELLSLPSVWRAHPQAVSDIVRFVCSMCEGPLIFRRIAAPRLAVEQAADGVGRFRHSMMNVSCKLAEGEVTLGMRFHDGRTARNAIFGGNAVSFSHDGRRYVVDDPKAISRYEILTAEDRVTLVWAVRLQAEKKTLFSKKAEIGELVYRCVLSAQSMFVDFEAAIDLAEGVSISDVIISFGFDRLSHNENGIRYEALHLVTAGGEAESRTGEPGARIEVPVNGAAYWSLAQTSHMSGFAAAIHSLPRDPSRVRALKARCDREGRWEWAASEHHFEGAHTGRIVAGERKIITSGGFYDQPDLYAAVLKRQALLSDAGAPPKDLSISYDYGAELNALAHVLGVLRGGAHCVPEPEATRLAKRVEAVLRPLLTAYNTHFIKPARDDPSIIFSRSLAYGAFTYAELLRQSGSAEHRRYFMALCEMISTFERPNVGVDGKPQSGFLMGTKADALPFVDCHAACLLALVRGAEAAGGQRWVAAIDRGLAAFCLDTQKFFHLGDQKIDVVCVDYQDENGARHRLETFWNFKAGLCLQLFNALRATSHPGLQAAWSKHRLRLELLETLMRARIAGSIRRRGDTLEILTSMLSLETNSETQPWVALGLLGETRN